MIKPKDLTPLMSKEYIKTFSMFNQEVIFYCSTKTRKDTGVSFWDCVLVKATTPAKSIFKFRTPDPFKKYKVVASLNKQLKPKSGKLKLIRAIFT